MIIVSDNRGDRVEVGDTREDLVIYLEETCSEDYAEKVLEWFDSLSGDPLVLADSPLALENGWEDVVDTWEWIPADDDESATIPEQRESEETERTEAETEVGV